MKQLLFSLVCIPMLCFSQVQIGQDIDGEAEGDRFGSSVSISSNGSIVAVGAVFNDGNGSNSGHVRVYENVSGVWTQIGQDIDGEAEGDRFGFSVSLSSDGSIVAVSAILNDGNGFELGHVQVYKNVSGVWTQIGEDIDGEADGDRSGFSVSLSSDGTVIAIGAILNDGNGFDSGHARVYENISGAWIQIGEDIDGEAAIDLSGSICLSSDGAIIAIGALDNYGNGFGSGHVRVYENISGVWTQIGQDIDGEAILDESGYAVSLSSDGSIVAIGASGNDGNGSDSGHVRVYENVSGVWTQIGQDIDGEAVDDFSGTSIALSSDGTIVAIGASGNDENGSNSGHVRIYKNVSGVWTKIGEDINGEAEGDGSASIALSLDGAVIALGAAFNDGNGENSGHVRIFDLSDVLSTNDFSISKFGIFPNPTKNQFTIQLQDNSQLQKVTIYNNLGQFVSTYNKPVINTSYLAQGLYVVEVKTTKGTTSQKLIIE